jgi:hypothetical protein
MHCIGGWAGTTAVLDMVVRVKITTNLYENILRGNYMGDTDI